MVNLVRSELAREILNELSEEELTKSELLDRTSAESLQVISNYISEMRRNDLVNIGSGRSSRESNQKRFTYVLASRGFRFQKILNIMNESESLADSMLKD